MGKVRKTTEQKWYALTQLFRAFSRSRFLFSSDVVAWNIELIPKWLFTGPGGYRILKVRAPGAIYELKDKQ
jgi:hypothetical protein